MSLRGFVPPRLHEHVQDLALAVDGSPQPQAFAPNHDRHFVEVPLVAWPGTKPTEVASESWPELEDPAPNRLEPTVLEEGAKAIMVPSPRSAASTRLAATAVI